MTLIREMDTIIAHFKGMKYDILRKKNGSLMQWEITW